MDNVGQECPTYISTPGSGNGLMPHRISDFVRRQRHLPHWEAPGETYFVTPCLKDRESCDLARDDIAPIILDALAHFDQDRYTLYDHVVMPDHVHAILHPIVRGGVAPALSSVLGRIKGSTAYRSNRLIRRKGALWLDETYDHIIRNEKEYHELARYIYENPVRRDLVSDGHDWKWWRPGHSGH